VVSEYELKLIPVDGNQYAREQDFGKKGTEFKANWSGIKSP